MIAKIKRVTHGKYKGQFRFLLLGNNGEIIATSETYTQKHNVLSILKTISEDSINEIKDISKKD